MELKIMELVAFLFSLFAVVMLNLIIFLNTYLTAKVAPFSKKFAVSIWGNSGVAFIGGSVLGVVIGDFSRSFIHTFTCKPETSLLNCTALLLIFLLFLYSPSIFALVYAFTGSKGTKIDSYLLSTLKEKEIPKSALDSLKKVLDSTFLYSFGTGTAVAESLFLFPKTTVTLGVIEIFLFLLMVLMFLLELAEKLLKIQVKNESKESIKRVKNPWS